ncbi:hypothetical protein PR002_g4622 [Phytophthora rubi]|nr:hypothetical protein PR002_g4622 [Phytophthora rubi]
MNVPVVRIRTEMSSYVDGDNLEEGGLAGIELVLPARPVETPMGTDTVAKKVLCADGVDAVASSSSKPKRRPKRKRLSKKRLDTSADDGADPVQFKRPSMPAVTVLSRRKRARPPHLRDYLINAVLQGTSEAPIPQSYKKAKRSQLWPEWKNIIESELFSLCNHETWRLVPHNSIGKAKVITCRWVFETKRNEKGVVVRYKARLVIHGYKQDFGVNFLKTYELKLPGLRSTTDYNGVNGDAV